MIHQIFSSLPSFKALQFGPGLNVLIARKEAGATAKQTRNRAGKTSLIEIIHFLTGAIVEKRSPFAAEALAGMTFGMTFDLDGQQITVERAGKAKSRVHLEGAGYPKGGGQQGNSEWAELLGERIFRLHDLRSDVHRVPTFRSLFSYFVRRQASGGFSTPEKHAVEQQPGDFQLALMYLLGLDWRIAAEWQKVRDRERTLRELRKAAGAGALGSIIGKASDLRTQVTVAESRLQTMQAHLSEFRVLPQYAEIQAEANQLTRRFNDLNNANAIDSAAIDDLEVALRSEAPPPIDDLESLYAEAGVALPGLAVKRYAEVRRFHESVISNRRDYLAGELEAAKQRVLARSRDMERLDERSAEVKRILNSHGALDQLSRLQTETARKQAEVESLRQRFDAAERLEGTKNELDIERNRLALRLRRDFSEQQSRLSEAILAFEETSKCLYESAGSMIVEETANGPQFQFPMQGSRSKGIRNMQIFCFDMMLMTLCAKRGIGPGFLVHDSHLFDGVDGRQVVSALKAGADTAQALGFQYIVTMNEDDAFKERAEGFRLDDHILPVVLTDAEEDGGLFGFRF